MASDWLFYLILTLTADTTSNEPMLAIGQTYRLLLSLYVCVRWLSIHNYYFRSRLLFYQLNLKKKHDKSKKRQEEKTMKQRNSFF